MNTSADFLHEIRAAARLMDIAPSTLCQRAVANGKLIGRLEAGGTVTISTVNRIRAYVAIHSPRVKRKRGSAKSSAAPSTLPQVTTAGA